MFIDDNSCPSNKLTSYYETEVFGFLLPFQVQQESLDPSRLLGALRHASTPERERRRELLL